MRTYSVKEGQAGQILLVVVLAAVISLTVGLAAIGRTITNTKVSIQEASSQRALSAAEAGAEKLLNNSNLFASQGTLSNSSGFNATVEEVLTSEVELNGGGRNFVKKDEGADIWLSKTDFSGQWGGELSIYWTDNDTSNGCTTAVPSKINAAIAVTLLSGVKNNPTMNTYTYDACENRRDGVNANNFDAPPSNLRTTFNNVIYQHGFKITVSNGFIARIIPVYADTHILVNGAGLPSQGRIIKSVGTAGSTTRHIKVFQGNPKIPTEFFPYNLFLP